MRIRSVSLRDFGTFETYKTDIHGPVIGIVGPNGSGKSTLLEGIYSALTGDFRRYPNLIDFVRDLPDGRKANSASVDVTFELNGTVVSVRRTLTVSGNRATQRARLRIKTPTGESRELEGVSNVRSELRHLVGAPLDLMNRYVFVPQNAMSSILDVDPAQRTRAIHQLFGLDRFEDIWKSLGKHIDSLPVIHVGNDVETLQDQLARLVSDIDSYEARIRSLRNELQLAGVDEARRDIETARKLAAVHNQITVVESRMTDANSRRSQAAAVAENAAVTVKNGERDLAAMQQRRNESQAFLLAASDFDAAVAARDVVLQQMTQCSQAIRALTRPEPSTLVWSSDEEAALTEMVSQLSVSERFVANYNALLSGGAVAAVCPTCRQPIGDLANELSRHVGDIDKLRPEVRQLKSRKEAVDSASRAYTLALSQYSTQIDLLTKRGSDLLSLFNTNAVKIADKDRFSADARAAARSVVEAYAVQIAALESARQNAARAISDLSVCESDVRKFSAEYKQLSDAIAVIGADPARLTEAHIQECERLIERSTTATTELIRLQERHRLAIEQRAVVDASLQRAAATAAKADVVSQARSMLTSAREVFHRTRLPMTSARQYTQSVDRALSEFLSFMQSRFTAAVEMRDDSYSFRCRFNDGCERDAAHMSGGERIRFCVGFLLAVNRALASQIGFIFLDEPTNHLDDEAKSQLGEVLLKLQSYAANAGMQIGVVTHSAQLCSAFDQTIEMNGGR